MSLIPGTSIATTVEGRCEVDVDNVNQQLYQLDLRVTAMEHEVVEMTNTLHNLNERIVLFNNKIEEMYQLIEALTPRRIRLRHGIQTVQS